MAIRAAAAGAERTGRALLRLMIALASTFLAVALCEGAYSLFTQRSLVDRLLAPQVDPIPRFDRIAAGALTPGPYALDPDPDVWIRVKPDSRSAFVGVPASTDAFGQRRTVRSVEHAERRVLLLGDSVAFGYGVADDETYASQLERWLASACPSARVAVETLACPGWNARSAFRALRDHVGRLDPDLVLYVAVSNDLDDPKGVDELGWHDIDVELDAARPACSDERHARMIATLGAGPSRATMLEVLASGGLRGLEHALRSGVTRESQRRWDAHIRAVGALHAELAARGIEFAVALPFDEDFSRQLELRLALAHPQIRVLGLCSEWTSADALAADPHPNAACVRAGAWRIARWLIDERRVPCEADALGPIPEAYRDRRYELVESARHRDALEEILAVKRAVFWPRIDFVDVRGVHQVYGGLLGDGTLGKHASFALARVPGTQLRVELERLAADTGLYPLELLASVLDGESRRELGRAVVSAPASGEDLRAEVAFELPPAADGERFVEVLLVASNWVVTESAAGRRPVSVRIRNIAIAP